MDMRSVVRPWRWRPGDRSGVTPAARTPTWRAWLWPATIAALGIGTGAWAAGAGFLAFWCFVAAAVGLALVLDLPYAFVSPLYMGVVGWLVDMLPLLILVGWATAVLRWAVVLVSERRLPRGGWWIWVPVGLVVWTALGVLVLPSGYLRHFALLFGLQVLVSGGVLALADLMSTHEQRVRVALGLVSYVVLLSVAVTLQWFGVNIQALQDDSISERLEAAYGVDAFRNETGMINYTRAKEAGAGELRARLRRLQRREPGLPPFVAFRPSFRAWDNVNLVVRFDGSARPYERQLRALDVSLVFDNVGLAPMNTVPRMRSFPRNSLTYAGICAATFPLALYLAWSERGRRRWIGQAGVAACLFGAAFSVARGAWVAILLGIVYLIVDTRFPSRRKLQTVAVYVAAAVVLTLVFVVRYNSDPLTARALATSSVTAREQLYAETIQAATGINVLLGYGTELPRRSAGTRAFGDYGRYIPAAGTHSTYLNYLFRTGVVGAAAIVALYLSAWLHARAAGRVSRTGDRSLAAALSVAVVIAAAHGTILSLFVEPAYTLTITIVLGLALACGLGLDASVLPWRTRPAAAAER